jgi:hypothetical protein
MSELSALHFAAFAILFGIGSVIGWLLRADRCAREKIAVNAGWQEQFESQQAESKRLAEQNRGLMEQINEHRAAEKDLTRRTREIAAALKESTARRDELMRHGKDLRGKLEIAIKQRNKLRTDIRSREAKSEASANAVREKDNKIFKLSRELTSWQNRVPPLVEKYRERELEMKELQYELEVAHERNREIDELQTDLARARDRIAELEARGQPEHTRIEPLDTNALPPGLDASNEQYNDAFEADLSDLKDQVVDDAPPPEAGNGRYGMDFVHGHADEPLDGRSFDRAPALPLRDDLQQIKGVGPAIERTLNELGIFRFEQIASISEYDIDRVAARLRGFRSRVYREDWIGQARTLHYQKLGGPPL